MGVVVLVILIGMPFSNTVRTLREDRKYSGYNARPSKIIYSGVRFDCRMITEPGDCPVPGVLTALMVIDLPFSVCADTICLPYTIYRRLTESGRVWRVVDVVFASNGVRLISLNKTEERDASTLAETCSVLQRITGKPRSVRVNVTAENTVSIADYGILYETIQSNTTLTLAYQSDGITRLSQQYLKEKTSNKSGAANGSQPIRSETKSTSSAAGSRR